MGFFSKIIRKVTKPIKKVIKSPLGKMALMGGLGYLGGAQAGFWGKGAANPLFGPGGGKGSVMAKLFGTAAKAGTGGAGPGLPFLAEKGFTGGSQGLLGKLGLTKGLGSMAPTGLGWGALAGIGAGGAAAMGAMKQPTFEQANAQLDTSGHDQYLRMRKQFGFGDPSSQYYTDPLWTANQGGRVPAQIGMSVDEESVTRDQGPAPQPEMSSVVQEEIDTAESQDTTADMMGTDTYTDESMMRTNDESSQLISLIQQLSAMGIPMEQLRGRTMEELVEMMVYVSAQLQGGVQEDVMSEQVTMAKGGRIGYQFGDEVQESTSPSDIFITDSTEILRGKPDGSEGGITNTNAAMGTEHPVIPSEDGPQLDMREKGGYQPHGAQEKKDDVRALLAQGEFVVTSDAVKGVGDGDRDLGAKRMYDMMHKWEAMA